MQHTNTNNNTSNEDSRDRFLGLFRSHVDYLILAGLIMLRQMRPKAAPSDDYVMAAEVALSHLDPKDLNAIAAGFNVKLLEAEWNYLLLIYKEEGHIPEGLVEKFANHMDVAMALRLIMGDVQGRKIDLLFEQVKKNLDLFVESRYLIWRWKGLEPKSLDKIQRRQVAFVAAVAKERAKYYREMSTPPDKSTPLVKWIRKGAIRSTMKLV